MKSTTTAPHCILQNMARRLTLHICMRNQNSSLNKFFLDNLEGLRVSFIHTSITLWRTYISNHPQLQVALDKRGTKFHLE